MECDEKIGARIRQFMDDCNTFYEQGQLSKARDSLFEAWGILPDEKYIYDESYWIVAFILDLSIELHDMDVANQWVDKILKCDLERQDDGDREMWVGKVLMMKWIWEYFFMKQKNILKLHLRNQREGVL